jgi:hypothetical protein
VNKTNEEGAELPLPSPPKLPFCRKHNKSRSAKESPNFIMILFFCVFFGFLEESALIYLYRHEKEKHGYLLSYTQRLAALLLGYHGGGIPPSCHNEEEEEIVSASQSSQMYAKEKKIVHHHRHR